MDFRGFFELYTVLVFLLVFLREIGSKGVPKGPQRLNASFGLSISSYRAMAAPFVFNLGSKEGTIFGQHPPTNQENRCLSDSFDR